MALSKAQKLELAKKVCEENGTKLDLDMHGEVIIVKSAGVVNKLRVRKLCTANPTHPAMEVSLGSIVASGRGGCAKCARIKGGQNSKRS